MTKVEKANARFARLSKPKQRISIAKDVIKHLDSKRIVAQGGTYFAITPAANAEPGVELQGILLADTVPCHACALGGMFYASVVKADQCTLPEPLIEGEEIELSHTIIRKNLSKYFSDKQMAFIESAFEESEMNYGQTKASEKAVIQASKFFSDDKGLAAIRGRGINRYQRQDSYKLRKIMKNVIKNKGTFKF